MIILVDTREQLPYEWKGVTIRFQSLKTGDYSLPGYEHHGITIERKRIVELWTITGRERERFERELERMSHFDVGAIVIEGTIQQVLAGDPRTQVPPAAVINSLVSWSLIYDVRIWWAGDRIGARAVTKSLLARFLKYRAQEHDVKQGGRVLS